MKKGDMVRFAKPEEVDHLNSKSWPKIAKRHFGVLIEHDKLMGTAQVLHEGDLYRIRVVFVEKASKRDFQND